jgi:hypothetical protein
MHLRKINYFYKFYIYYNLLNLFRYKITFVEEIRCLLEIFKKLTSTEKESLNNLDTKHKSSGNSVDSLSHTSSQFKNAADTQNTKQTYEKNIKIIKEEITLKILLKIFKMHFEKIETSGLPFTNLATNNNHINKNNNTNINKIQNQINANLNQQYNDKIMKLSNEIIVCLFKGVNFFSSKYINKKTLASKIHESTNNKANKPIVSINLMGFIEEEKYLTSKAELKIIYKILLILNKFNFLKAKPVLGNSSNFSPRNTVTEKENTNNLALAASSVPNTNPNQTVAATNNTNFNNLNSNVASRPAESANPVPNQLTAVKANFILQKFLIKYSEKQQSTNTVIGKIDYIDEILDSIESIIRNLQVIIFTDILERIVVMKNKKEEILNKTEYDKEKNINNNDNDNKNDLLSLADNKEFYLEILNFIKTMSNNSGYSLFLIKNGVYLFALYFINKFESKQFKNTSPSPKECELLNEIAQICYFILKNLITHTHSFLRTPVPKASNATNPNPQQIQNNQQTTYFPDEINNANLNNLKNQKSEKYESANLNQNANLNVNATAAVNNKNNEITVFNKLGKIYQMFDKVMKSILQNYFYELILNPISNSAGKEQGAVIKLENINPGSQSLAFLTSFKSSIENPDFIWNKNYRKELKKIIFNQLKKLSDKKFKINFILFSGMPNNNTANPNLNSINASTAAFPESQADANKNNNPQNISTITKLNSNSSIVNNINCINYENKSEYEVVNIEHLENLQVFEYYSSKKELRIGKIYIRVYNKNNEFKLDNPNQFLEALKQNLLAIDFENFINKEYFESLKKEDFKLSDKENEKEANSINNNQNTIETNTINNTYNINKNDKNDKNVLIKEKENLKDFI